MKVIINNGNVIVCMGYTGFSNGNVGVCGGESNPNINSVIVKSAGVNDNRGGDDDNTGVVGINTAADITCCATAGSNITIVNQNNIPTAKNGTSVIFRGTTVKSCLFFKAIHIHKQSMQLWQNKMCA